MIKSAYYANLLIFIGAAFRKKLVSRLRAVIVRNSLDKLKSVLVDSFNDRKACYIFGSNYTVSIKTIYNSTSEFGAVKPKLGKLLFDIIEDKPSTN